MIPIYYTQTNTQVLDERIYHLEYVPETPESYYKPTGNELQPRPVGEENGVVVFNYNPVSAVNYVSSIYLLLFFALNQSKFS